MRTDEQDEGNMWKYVDVEDYVDEGQYYSEKVNADYDEDSDEESGFCINRSGGGAEATVRNEKFSEEEGAQEDKDDSTSEDVNHHEEISREEGLNPKEIDMNSRRNLQKMFSDKKDEIRNVMWPQIHKLMAQSRDTGSDVDAQDDEREDVDEGSNGHKKGAEDEEQYICGEENLDKGNAARYIYTNEEGHMYREGILGEEEYSEEAEHISHKETDKLEKVIYPQGWNSNDIDRHKERLFKKEFERMVLKFNSKWRISDFRTRDNFEEQCNTDEERDVD
ncbi:MAG: hypothetical protein LQ342_008050 [Letrouitia transgressa]|nr:MAG: hypothetical protein LQ342_008050 [Letrouitia transgressa]